MNSIKSIIVAGGILCTPLAQAEGFSGMLWKLGSKLGGAAIDATVDGVGRAIKASETPEQKVARQRAEVEKAAEDILAGYPPEKREAARPEVIRRLTLLQAKYNATSEYQDAVKAERQSLTNSVTSAIADTAKETGGTGAALVVVTPAAVANEGAPQGAVVQPSNRSQIEADAEYILSQYPASQRDAMRPKVVEQLILASKPVQLAPTNQPASMPSDLLKSALPSAGYERQTVPIGRSPVDAAADFALDKKRQQQ